MDIQTGEILYGSAAEKAIADPLRKMVKITEEEADTLKSKSKSQRKNWMRNRPCPCGSGKKFKKCCWAKY